MTYRDGGWITVGTPVQSTISNRADAIRYNVQLTPGTKYLFYVSGADSGGGSMVDPMLSVNIYGGTPTIVFDDNSGVGRDGAISWTPTYSTQYTVQVNDTNFLLSAAATGSFTLYVVPDTGSYGSAGNYQVPAAGTMPVYVSTPVTPYTGTAVTPYTSTAITPYTSTTVLPYTAQVAYSTSGNDTIVGGTGLNVVIFTGRGNQYTVNRGSSTITITGPDGTDTLSGIQRLKFTDGTYVIDSSDRVSQALRLYTACLGREPDSLGLAYYARALDGGWSLASIATGFITSAEFRTRYGTLSNTQFVDQLYQNVLHRSGSVTEISWYAEKLSAGTMSREAVVVGFSESQENRTNTSALTTGMWLSGY